MTPTTVLDVVGWIVLELQICKKTKLSDSIKRYTYSSLSKAIPQSKIELHNKINFNVKNEKSKNTDIGQGYKGAMKSNPGPTNRSCCKAKGLNPGPTKKIVLRGQGFKPRTYKKIVLQDQGIKPWTYKTLCTGGTQKHTHNGQTIPRLNVSGG